MDDDFDELVVSVRADTGGFARDIQAMKSEFDTSLLGGFDAAGKVLERSLANALRTGKFEFEDLKRVALSVLDQIAARLLESGFDAMFGGSSKGGFDLSSLGDMLGSMFGLPGRATGGIVSPDRPFLVGERGPEVFVPASAGHVEPNHRLGGTRNDVRVNINLGGHRGGSAPAALQRSSRQVASAVRRALWQ